MKGTWKVERNEGRSEGKKRRKEERSLIGGKTKNILFFLLFSLIGHITPEKE